MASRLLYVMDPMCSWCWGFAPVMQALAEQAAAAGVVLHLVVGGLRREQHRLEPADRQRLIGYWTQVAEATGQPFDAERGLPAGLVYDTEPACRALVTARGLQPEKAWVLALAIQQAFYCEGRDVTRGDVLLALAEGVGLEGERFAALYDAAAQREATEADFRWAQNLGIAGFPTLLAERDGQLALLTNGYRPLSGLQPLLARWLEQGGHG